MASLFPLVTQIVIEGITKGAGPVLPHLNGKGVVLGAIAIIMTIQASAFALISLFIHLQNYTSPVYAALIVSCCLLFGAACFALAGWGAIRRYGFITYHRSSRSGSPANDLAQSVKDLVEGVTAELEEPIRDNPKMAIALASLAGYLVGDFNRRR